MSLDELRTSRLLLRRWRPEDLEAFAAMNADPEVMEFFPLERASSDAMVGRIEAGFAGYGFGLWALEVASSGGFIGFTGVSVPGFEAAFTPAVEIGWRLARPAWGQGYATEAATAATEAAFGPLRLAEVVSFTSVANLRSQAVMRRLGMIHDPAEGFDGIVHCEVLALERPRLLRISWVAGGIDTTATWRLIPEGAGTRLFLAHDGFDEDDPCQQATRRVLGGGWRGHLVRRLEETLAALT